jgi:RimJ/RimL family protein N-acetyltransferase
MTNHPLPSPRALEGRFVRLQPFSEALRSAVKQALDCDSEGWAVMATNGGGEGFDGWWAEAMSEAAKGARQPYAIQRLDDGRVMGTSSFLALRPAHGGVEIGATFLHPEARTGFVNPESKRLMLTHAFDGGLFGAPAERVEIMVDARNLRSRAAVLKLGAVQEGMLRKHKLTWTGHLRDTVAFSILADEWPTVRDGLDARLAAA